MRKFLDAIAAAAFGIDNVKSLRTLSSCEIDRSGIAAAQENADVLSGSGFIATRNECGEGGSTPRLGDYPQGLPES